MWTVSIWCVNMLCLPILLRDNVNWISLHAKFVPANVSIELLYAMQCVCVESSAVHALVKMWMIRFYAFFVHMNVSSEPLYKISCVHCRNVKCVIGISSNNSNFLRSVFMWLCAEPSRLIFKPNSVNFFVDMWMRNWFLFKLHESFTIYVLYIIFNM